MCRKLIFLIYFALLLGIAGNASAELVAHWRFDEGSGIVAHDTSGNGNDGTFNGDPQWVPGHFGYALEFDGDGDLLDCGNNPVLALTDAVSISAWIKVAVLGSDHKVGGNQDGANGGYKMSVYNDKIEFEIRTSGNSAVLNRSVAGGTVLEVGLWYHVVGVYSLADGYIRTYVNGELDRELATTETLGVSSGALMIGCEPFSTGQYNFNGVMDDIRIYSHALTQGEILGVMEGGQRGPYALGPTPEDGALHEDTWVELGWTPGDTAASHDVYLGDNFDDVNDGSESTFRGNQPDTFFVVGFPGFPYPDGLVPGTTYYWRIDEVNDTEPNSPWKGPVWSFMVPPRTAYYPIPADGAQFIDPNNDLSWTPGVGAKLHTVYFGDNFDDVNNASGGQPQGSTTYALETLELDKTYYWRVDEFDAITTYKGDIWSFKTLPVISITQPSLIGWWKFDEDYGTTAIDDSGYGNHGNFLGDPEWVDGYDGYALEFDGSGDFLDCGAHSSLEISDAVSITAWIKVAVQGADHKVGGNQDGANGGYKMSVYNDKVEFEIRTSDNSAVLNRSVAGGTVLDVGLWYHVAGVYSLADGYIRTYVNGNLDRQLVTTEELGASPGTFYIGCEPFNTGSNNFNGVMDDVRLYSKALTQDEIKETMRADPLLAGTPNPNNGSTPYIREATPLSWAPGDEAAEHDVYFGTDKESVSNADVSDTTGIYRGRQGTTTYNPPEGVEWGGGPYHWRIDEYNTDGTITEGKIWTFTVADYLIVDDFEDYDVGNNEIWWAWKDGLGYASHPTEPPYAGNGTGSIVGDETTYSYTEETIVHGGGKSMPLFYDNNQQGKFKYSEAEMTLSSRRDWTEQGVRILSLWFYGDVSNVAEPLYVALNDNAVVTHDNPNVTQVEAWTQWTIDLQAFADQGVNLADVNSIAIGLGNKKNPVAGGSGTMYIDDIRLYRPVQ